MINLFRTHWVNHDELVRLMASDPKSYLKLAYWVGYQAKGVPVFFVTQGPDHEPDIGRDPRFLGWEIECPWQRLGHPAEAEGVLTGHFDETIQPGKLHAPVDVHCHIQFPR